MSLAQSFTSGEGIEIAYQGPELPPEAIGATTLELLAGDHIGAVADPRSTRAVVDLPA
ncbi:MAG: hypothetical protein ABSG95_12770 [Solirubrobacteraceae bacterium]